MKYWNYAISSACSCNNARAVISVRNKRNNLKLLPRFVGNVCSIKKSVSVVRRHVSCCPGEVFNVARVREDGRVLTFCSMKVTRYNLLTFQSFRRQSNLLFKILSNVKSHQASPHLSQLLLRIDFNKYFSKSGGQLGR